ncbi:hypothetical protein R7O12_10730 [Vibrio sp. Vb1574]|uniref:hypothetical protein n=1 Tax=Vibrio sp. Vb1574 TaxID=3074643 RepID=UPI002964E008|nr:hypothetical protein [Vibrio sp. Vb1574]MDW1889687.1 hypothetical protein [Vibrio sp. Vb1574]
MPRWLGLTLNVNTIAPQREQIRRLQIELGCSSREELVLYAINLLGQQHGIYLKDIQEDLACLNKKP